MNKALLAHSIVHLIGSFNERIPHGSFNFHFIDESNVDDWESFGALIGTFVIHWDFDLVECSDVDEEEIVELIYEALDTLGHLITSNDGVLLDEVDGSGSHLVQGVEVYEICPRDPLRLAN